MAKRAVERANRIKQTITRWDPTKGQRLAIVDPVQVREILQLEAAKPMRGGDAPLTHNSLFGDSHLQGSMF